MFDNAAFIALKATANTATAATAAAAAGDIRSGV